MSVLIVGTTALRFHQNSDGGKSATARRFGQPCGGRGEFFSPVKLVGGVGEDFPKKYIELYRRHKIDLIGLQMLPGKTFHWSANTN